jgi:hypothetical protein
MGEGPPPCPRPPQCLFPGPPVHGSSTVVLNLISDHRLVAALRRPENRPIDRLIPLSTQDFCQRDWTDCRFRSSSAPALASGLRRGFTLFAKMDHFPGNIFAFLPGVMIPVEPNHSTFHPHGDGRLSRWLGRSTAKGRAGSLARPLPLAPSQTPRLGRLKRPAFHPARPHWAAWPVSRRHSVASGSLTKPGTANIG